MPPRSRQRVEYAGGPENSAADLELPPGDLRTGRRGAPRPAPSAQYLNHRARQRERVLRGGGSALHDYEVMELILFRAIPRQDVKPLAKALIQQFGNVWGVLNVRPEVLMGVPGVKEAVATEMQILREVLLRAGRDQIMHKPIVDSWPRLVAYLRSAMGHAEIEQFRVLYVDIRHRLIADEVMNLGTIDQAPVYPREIMRRAIELSASAVILVHNHPSGDPTPSRADVEMTKLIIATGKPVQVNVIDHLIVSRTATVSLKQMGMM